MLDANIDFQTLTFSYLESSSLGLLDEQANAYSRRYFVTGAQLLRVSNLTLLEILQWRMRGGDPHEDLISMDPEIDSIL